VYTLFSDELGPLSDDLRKNGFAISVNERHFAET
jgi:hypothetical protein